jgi:hypothetical protein
MITASVTRHPPEWSDPRLAPWKLFLISATVACLSFWDFFIGEIRIFDFIGLLLFLLVLASVAIAHIGNAPRFERRTLLTIAVLFFLVFVFSLIGIQSNPDNLKPSVGMLFGVLILTLGRCLVLEDHLLDRSIAIVAWIHVSAFLFQLGVFYSTKQIVNFHAVFGLQPRLISSVFRPAGLFLEPAIYCFFACSLFFLRRQRKRPFTALDALLILSMLLSLSLWGIAIALALFFVFRTGLALFITVALSIAAYFALDVHNLNLSHSFVFRFFEMRLSGLGSDPSTQGRYGGTIDWLFSLLANPTILFGNGINNFFEEHGSNGWAFILNSMGLIGTSILFVLLWLLAPPRRWFLFAVAFAILLTAAPLWKTFYFWCWIALMLRPTASDAEALSIRTRAVN